MVFRTNVLVQTDAHRIRNNHTLCEAKFDLMVILVFLGKEGGNHPNLGRLLVKCEGEAH